MKVELGKVYTSRTNEQREIVAISGDKVSYLVAGKKRNQPSIIITLPAESFLQEVLDDSEAAGPLAGATADAPPTVEESPTITQEQPEGTTVVESSPSAVDAGERQGDVVEVSPDLPRKRRSSTK